MVLDYVLIELHRYFNEYQMTILKVETLVSVYQYSQ